MNSTVFDNSIVHNEFALVNEEHNRYYVTHFGIVPEEDDLNFQTPPMLVSGGRNHFLRDQETMLWRSPDVTAWVSGSWACWGPQNQDTEGDLSLHVKIYTPHIPTVNQLQAFWNSLWNNISKGGNGRVIDYAIITGHGDNDPIQVALYRPETKPVMMLVKAAVYPTAAMG